MTSSSSSSSLSVSDSVSDDSYPYCFFNSANFRCFNFSNRSRLICRLYFGKDSRINFSSISFSYTFSIICRALSSSALFSTRFSCRIARALANPSRFRSTVLFWSTGADWGFLSKCVVVGCNPALAPVPTSREVNSITSSSLSVSHVTDDSVSTDGGGTITTF